MWRVLPALLLGCAPSPQRVFERDVVPILERSCLASTCHGVAPGAEASGDVIAWDTLMIRVDAAGRVVDPAAAREAALRAVNTVEDPAFSTLLRKPLPGVYGGLPHFGGANFHGPSDPALRAIAAWIATEPRGGEDPTPLDRTEQRFADEVEPILVGLGCATGGCHGLDAAVPFRLDPGLAGAIPIAATRANLATARAMIAADSVPERARLLRKVLPLHDGGIAHKPGNATFLTGLADPRAKVLVDWICDEREARSGADCRAAPTGVVYVRGPVPPSLPFDLDTPFAPTELWLADLDPSLHVTARHRLAAELDGADLREPAVDEVGERVVFAARITPDVGHELWELHLPTGELRPLTAGSGPLPGGGVATWRDPTWGPDGRVWAVSTREGLAADRGLHLDSELFAIDPDSGAIERHSWTPHAERHPTFLRSGTEEGGELCFTALRDAVAGQDRAHPFRFPLGLDTEYHQHFGITPPEDAFLDLRELADGRYAAVVGDLGGSFAAGQLGVIDRNQGPELASEQAALPRYVPPLSRIDVASGSTGRVARAWRDPVGLPDGTLLAAVARDVDLEGVEPPDFGLAHVVLHEAPDGSGATLDRWSVLVDDPGVAESDPQPIYRRSPVPDGPWSWDPTSDRARLVHQGWPTIDALLGRLEPAGVKVGADAVAVRIVEPIPLTPAQRAGASLGRHGPARILAEVPLAADGTFHVDLPANTAIRLVGIDADGLAVGHPHNRWFDLHPGQTVKQGIQPDDYASRCAACHGALDGDPDHVFVEPDVMTTASLTLARYRNGDPRRPLDPVSIGDDTAITVDFVRDLQPILDGACLGCHEADPDLPRLDGEVTDGFSAAYASLLPFVDEPGARSDRSPLLELLLGRELDAPGAAPAVPHAALDPDDVRTLARWIDLGATWRGGSP